MPILFEYECTDCGEVFEHLKMRSDEPDPTCPICLALSKKNFTTVNIGTNKGRAVDEAYRIHEQNTGMTDMKDNLREGDVAVPNLSPALQAQAKNFFGSGNSPIMGELINKGRVGAQEAAKEGVNPLRMLHNVQRQTGIKTTDELRMAAIRQTNNLGRR